MVRPKGIALIAVIAIIVIISIMVLALARLVSNTIGLNAARTQMEEALFAAQAGVCRAMYDYRENATAPYWSKYANQGIGGNAYYTIGKDANFLLVDADNPLIANTSSYVMRRFSLTNMNETQKLTISRMKVEWSGFEGKLLKICLNFVSRWSGTASSGQIVDFAPQQYIFTLNPKTTYGEDPRYNYLQFSVPIPRDATIAATFYMAAPPKGDSSSRKVVLLNGGRSGNKEFFITSTGQVRGSTTWKRTIEATYDVGVNRITSWRETSNHI